MRAAAAESKEEGRKIEERGMREQMLTGPGLESGRDGLLPENRSEKRYNYISVILMGGLTLNFENGPLCCKIMKHSREMFRPNMAILYRNEYSF